MINSDIIIKLKDCSEKQRSDVKDILLSNYLQLLDAIEKEADYCTVDSYWKNYISSSKPIISADEFISKYDKNIKTKSKNFLDYKHRTDKSSILYHFCLRGCMYEFFESK